MSRRTPSDNTLSDLSQNQKELVHPGAQNIMSTMVLIY